jgi:hypothetical protein
MHNIRKNQLYNLKVLLRLPHSSFVLGFLMQLHPNQSNRSNLPTAPKSEKFLGEKPKRERWNAKSVKLLTD